MKNYFTIQVQLSKGLIGESFNFIYNIYSIRHRGCGVYCGSYSAEVRTPLKKRCLRTRHDPSCL